MINRRGVDAVRSDARLIAASELFDADWYAGQRPGAVPASHDPAEHYLRSGAASGLEPGPGFSGARYLQAYPDVAAAGLNPLLHYLKYGRGEGRRCFSVDGSPSVAERDIELLSGSGLFDAVYYLQSNPDVRASGMDPVRHYVEHGAREGRSPHPFFDTGQYRARYMAADDESNPLAHYARAAGSATAATSSRFDGRFYGARHPESVASGSTPLEYFLEQGLSRRHLATTSGAGVAALPRTIDLRRVACTVVVPVHDAHDAVAACLDALTRNTSFGEGDRLLVIDDASTDPRITALLGSIADRPGIRVIRNPENLGYTRTVNRALAMTGDDDVVLLNSDTLVGPHWLRRLKVTACRHDRIGTVTAVSNAAGEFSVPAPGNSPSPEIDADALARAVADSGAEPFEVPTGNGFCMYVRRGLVAAIGGFDEEAFPTGYGEENDFCMRAGAAGWANLVDPSVYVQHVRSASFGDRRDALAQAGFERVAAMYPAYTGAIRAIGSSPAFAEARYRIDRQFRRLAEGACRPRPRILYVISTRVGGTPQTNADLMQAVSGDYDAIALCSDGRQLDVLHVVDGEYEVLERHVLNDPIRFANHASLEYDVVVAGILLRWNVDLVHIRHLAWHGLGLVETARGLGIAVVNSFHDYYTVCPTVNLLDEQGEFHPRGVQRHAPNPLWDQDPTVLPMSAERLDAWQARMQKTLAGADAFVTTSMAARKLIGEALPLLAARADDFHVIPHGRDFATFGAGPEPGPDDAGRPLRVLLAGNLSAHKGAVLVRELKQRDAKGEFEFHVMGSFPEQLAPYVVDHGPYRRSEFGAMVARIAPDIAAVLSVWPETYCHVLTECWACGLPVLGVDIGAVGERIRQHGGGWLLDFPATSVALHDRLAELSRSALERRQRVQDVRRWQIGEGTTQSTAWMAQRYADLYRDVMARNRRLRDVTAG